MNFKLYNTTSPKNKVTKTISLIADVTGESNISLDEHNISFVLSSSYLSSVKNSNYLYSTDTGKYYYIDNYEIKNQCVILKCKLDVLMTYRNEILQQTCTISRNEKISNAYMYDDGYQLLAYKNIVTKAFPNAIDDNTIILMTIG